MTAIRDMTAAKRAKANKSLDMLVRLDSGEVLRNRDRIDRLRAEGGVVKTHREHLYKKEDEVKEKIARLFRDVPFGNPNHPDTKRFYAEKARLEASLESVRVGVELPDGRFSELNKTELEYFEGTAPSMPPGTTGG